MVTATPYARGSVQEKIARDRCPCMKKGPAAAWDSSGDGFRHHRHEARVARRLVLTKEQLTQIRDLRTKFQNDTKAIRDELFQRRVEFRKLFSDPQTDESLLTAKSREMSSLQQKMMDSRIQLRLEERKILTPEQLKKLAGMTNERRIIKNVSKE
jgi:Spy/CpxP family protein refolding chaperone